MGFIGKLGESAVTESSLMKQLEILVGRLCPDAGDPQGCEVGFNTWWAQIGQCNENRSIERGIAFSYANWL